MERDDQAQLAELATLFLAQHEASRARMRVLRSMLGKAVDGLGHVPPAELGPSHLARWRASMPAPTRWQATQALKQLLRWAARWQLIEHDPLTALANPRPRPREQAPFDSWEQVERLAGQLPARLRALPIVGAGTGLRPGELLGLHWSSIELERGLLRVERSCVDGQLQSGLKTRASRRAVPLRERVVQALAATPPAARSGLVFTRASGLPIVQRDLRAGPWRRASERAGIVPRRRMYDLRHTYATWALRAGIGTFQLARRMGTSVAMIDATYGHLAADAMEHERSLMDAWDGAAAR